MLSVPGYSGLVPLYEQPHVLIFKAYSEGLNRNVLLKVLRSEFPTPEEVARYQHEFELLKEDLGPGVPRALDLIQSERSWILALEDIGGISLLDEMKNKPFSLSERLDLSVAIVKALARVHEAGIIHTDLKPANIIVNRKTGQVQIIDFGMAVRAKALATENQKLAQGTLHYMSPEQTGRTQRLVTFRSDFYSLGVSLYQLFSGKLPFTGKDELEWIHAHIAQNEELLHQLDPAIPLPIAMIVQKLMRKAPEDRYQSALGILRDLTTCREMVDQGLGAKNFVAGTQDISAEFQPSAKLYGRQKEEETVKNALLDTLSGGKRLILIGGEPGVGKSSIGNVVKEEIKGSDGYFIAGKYDQFRKDVPFSALIAAFNQLVSRILSEDESQIQLWRKKFLAALGGNGAVVSAVLPQIELIIGKCAPIANLRGAELRQRFEQTFHSFIRACCEPGRPLVIFLDDLQWADSASRSLLQSFLSEKEAQSLLFIGAYRDNELTAGHPLSQLLIDLEDAGIPMDRLRLANLTESDIADLLTDTFRVAREVALPLAGLVYSKTAGNPFFVTQFLKALCDKDLVHFNSSEGWRWDLRKIESQDMTSNVLSLLGDKIGSLPKECQETLTLAACFGNQFNSDELKSYNHLSAEQNGANLRPALQLGLITEPAAGEFRFIHDRVQEAAYRILDTAQRSDIHWRIANSLLKQWDRATIHARIFYLVNHWNAGSARVTSPEERETGAELNLLAAEAAKSSSVFDLSLSYALRGIECLGGDDWTKHESLLRPLYLLRAEAEFALSRFGEAKATFQLLLNRVSDQLQKARIYRTVVDLNNIIGEHHEAIRWGLEALNILGYRTPEHPNAFMLIYSLYRGRFALRRSLRRPGVDTTPPDELTTEVVSLCSSLGTAAYQVGNRKFMLYYTMTLLSEALRDRYFELNGRSLITAILWQRFNNFDEARRSADYILKGFEVNPLPPNEYRSYYIFAGFSAPMLYTFKLAVEYLKRGMERLYQNGDLIYSASCAQYLGALASISDSSLERTEERIHEYTAFIRKINYPVMLANMDTLLLFVRTLRGKTLAPGSFATAEMSDEDFLRKIREQESSVPLSWYNMSRMLSHYILGQEDETLSYLDDVKAAAANTPFSIFTQLTRSISAQLLQRRLHTFRGLKKLAVWFRIRREIKFFKKLSAQNPNFGTLYGLMVAEQELSAGRVEAAIATLREAVRIGEHSELPVFAAIANERLADIYINQGAEKVALLYLREALFFYESWGAEAKVKVLTTRHPSLLAPSSASGSFASSGKSGLFNLDVHTVLKASNTLISEIDMGRLVKKLLGILIENAGAERGLLILKEGNGLTLKGEIRVQDESDFELTNLPVDSFTEISKTLVAYVARTHETVVLENASLDDRTSRDEYVVRAKVLSTLCLPILSKGELNGLIYLEHCSSPGVFSPERVELIQTLAGQIAISIENARLYEHQAKTIRMENELATAQAVQEMLFPTPHYESGFVSLAGYYKPATECGGDWWYYSQIGEWTYVWLGDATGHGAPAALVTSAACSAVSMLENIKDLTPEQAMGHLNRAICRATKGRINMTFFVGAIHSTSGEFRYVRASHDMPYWIKSAGLGEKKEFSEWRANVTPLSGINGCRLGESANEVFEAQSIQLAPGDSVVLFTDGIIDLYSPQGRAWGERGFLNALHNSLSKGQDPVEAVHHVVAQVEEFGAKAELVDDVTLCIVKFKGGQAGVKQAA